MQTELQVLQESFESVNGQFKRALADYQNLEKRVAEGRSEMNSWAVNDLMRQIAQVMHYFDQAFKGVSEEEQKSSWFKGVKMANLQLGQVLQNAGLEEISIDLGSESGTGSQFDPALHEAVDTRDGEDGKILEVVEKGYKLNGKILKPARVIVGKKE
jgi:molecular chaperone GrpE